ncbi:disease resistance protein RPV1-like [Ziziphus jujuba]|uniref:Disease resistance protein RPV1-like n=1 Tax=Ziziphus jujuba TaxID=326968 RepID=A0ABM4A7J6_ZIZJJ|nr:disease resistance protein RPV1-like [Ziziphus jujuba]
MALEKQSAVYQANSTNIKYKEKLPKWKDALKEAGNLAGWHIDHLGRSHEFRDESQLIQIIVEAALSKLNRTHLDEAKNPVGLEARVKDLDPLMNVGSDDDAQVIGIYGIDGVENLKVGTTDRGINIIKERLGNKRILLVLDDVDHFEQLDKLARTPDCLNAFKENKPIQDYYELSERIVRYTDGLPLALVVLGSYLCKRSKPAWESAVDNLESKPNKQVYETLKISFDALEDNVKTIFLDIACFLVGDDKDHVIKVLGSSFKFSPIDGFEVLLDMSLITVESDKGTNAIEGIKLELPKPKTLCLSAKAFENMKRLRLLIFHNVVISTAVEYLPTELKYIDWSGYQFPTLPFNPGPKQLVILNMPHSHIHQLGEGFKLIS